MLMDGQKANGQITLVQIEDEILMAGIIGGQNIEQHIVRIISECSHLERGNITW